MMFNSPTQPVEVERKIPEYSYDWRGISDGWWTDDPSLSKIWAPRGTDCQRVILNGVDVTEKYAVRHLKTGENGFIIYAVVESKDPKTGRNTYKTDDGGNLVEGKVEGRVEYEYLGDKS